jgi:hypothetical protein
MEKLTRYYTARPRLMRSLLIAILGLMLAPAYAYSSGLEEELKLESWMVTPFESEFTEFELQMENWMITPFESEFTEFELQMENWMITPFTTEFAEFDNSLEAG